MINLIKSVFIPEQIKGNYLFPTRVIGFDIGKTQVNATQVLLKGKTITIEKCIQIPLENNGAVNIDERISHAITAILAQVDPFDEIHTCLPSSLAIFKELKLPFIGRTKISMIINFEIEPLLPFSLDNAVIDFVVTKENKEEKSSEILVAAVPKEHIAHHLSLFANAGVSPELVTIDFFSLYGLYRAIPSFAHITGGAALVDLGAHSTTIGYLYDGQLRLIRSLPKGILSLAKSVSTRLNQPLQKTMDTIIRYGLEKDNDPEYTQAMTSALASFWQDISFTLKSFTTQTESPQSVKHIIVLGGVAQMNGLCSFVTNQVGITCNRFTVNALSEIEGIEIPHKNSLSDTCIISASAAIKSPITAGFNLRKNEFSLTTDSALLLKQLVATASLAILILVSLGTHYVLQTRKLSIAAQDAEQETVEVLRKNFRSIASIPPEEEIPLEDMIRRARSELQKEEKLWFAFNPARSSYLQYLLELTNVIDKEALDFRLDRLRIADESMTIVAHVKDYNALILFEKELRQSKLFQSIESQNKPDFTMTIKLAPNG